MHIVLIDTVDPVLEERLSAAGHTCSDRHTLANDELPEGLADAEAIVVRSRKLPASLLSELPSLRLIGRVGSGLENIDTAFCAEKGITVLNAPEGNRDGVGEMALAHLLMLLKHIRRADRQVRNGRWLREPNRGHELRDRCVGIIGHGNMGSAFAEKLAGMGAVVLAHDRYVTGFGRDHVQESTLERIMAECDVVSLHLPLNEETRHYVDKAFLAGMKRPFWLLNTARGPLVDTAALIDALDEGRILGAGLDVLEMERDTLDGINDQDPVFRRLLTYDNVILTPHVAGVTHEGKFRMADILATKMLKAIADAPQ